MPLTDTLQDPVTSQNRAEIIDRLWPPKPNIQLQPDDLNWNAYFNFYTRECQSALIGDGANVSVERHEDIVFIARLLEQGQSEHQIKDAIVEELAKSQTRPANEQKERSESSIILAIRLLAMVNIRPLPHELSGTSPLGWTYGPLKSFLQEYFDETPEFKGEDIVLEKDFTAHQLNQAGIQVDWTNDIADHLRLVDENKRVYIFHHISFLKWIESHSSDLYPSDLAQETLQTLTILFPDNDRHTKRYLRKELSTTNFPTGLDRGLLTLGHFRDPHASRKLDNFKFWHNRLGVLKEALEEAEQDTQNALRKSLFGRRKGEHWFNSWVAIFAIGLTVFFGMVQSIEGAIQVYKAYNPT